MRQFPKRRSDHCTLTDQALSSNIDIGQVTSYDAAWLYYSLL